MNSIRATMLWAVALFAVLLAGVPTAKAADTATPSAAPAAEPGPTLDPKKIFAANCSWCHRGYGMEAGAGPRLAGTAMSEDEVKHRIRNGKPGYMPPFKDALTEEQIAVMAHFVKSLKAPE